MPEATLSPSRNSSSTLAGGDSSSSFYKQQQEEDDIKDEATAIRLAADLATKRQVGGGPRVNSISRGSMVPPSSSRQRIRDLLNKQRGGDDEPTGGPLSNSSSSTSTNKDPFQPNLGKMLWVYR